MDVRNNIYIIFQKAQKQEATCSMIEQQRNKHFKRAFVSYNKCLYNFIEYNKIGQK